MRADRKEYLGEQSVIILLLPLKETSQVLSVQIVQDGVEYALEILQTWTWMMVIMGFKCGTYKVFEGRAPC